MVRWSNSENIAKWKPDTTNTAGSTRFDGGSVFLKAVETTTETLVFTDATLHSLRFIGPPFTLGQTRIGTNIQLETATTDTAGEKIYLADSTENAVVIIDAQTLAFEKIKGVGSYPWGTHIMDSKDNYCH